MDFPKFSRWDFTGEQTRRMEHFARRSMANAIDAGSEDYDRGRHLARLIPVGPDEIADQSPPARRAILAKLSRALRAERNRGRAGHWTYDLNRHIGLCQAYAAERRLQQEPRSQRLPETETPARGRRFPYGSER